MIIAKDKIGEAISIDIMIPTGNLDLLERRSLSSLVHDFGIFVFFISVAIRLCPVVVRVTVAKF